MSIDRTGQNANRINTEADEMIRLLGNKDENYIFGCGWMGQKFLEAVQALGFRINAFVVTSKNVPQLQGIPVISLEELGPEKRNAKIWVALRDQDPQLNQRLAQLFSVVRPVTYPKDITLIEARFFLDYLKGKNISCDENKLRIGDFSFINPFQKADDYLLSWVYEAGDLILPVIFSDYSRVDEGPYEQEYTPLKEQDVVLDCGANIGLFTGVALQKGCKVYAFEPMPDAAAYLEELKEEYGSRLEICPFALADECGTAEFHVQNHDLLGASMLENNNKIDKSYQIEVTTIDDFAARSQVERVDYIKADIEGSERDMLKGARNTIRRFHPKISICTYHLPDDKEVLEAILKEIEPRYKIMHQWKKMYAYVPE